MTFEYTTYNEALALSALKCGLTVSVCHPDDPFTGEAVADDPMRNPEDIREAEGHLFAVKFTEFQLLMQCLED
jgi:hypothetical protein